MIYITFTDFRLKTCRFSVFSFLIAVLFLNILSMPVFAEVEFGPTAEEYRDIGYQAQQEGDFNRALTFYHKVLGMGEKDSWIYNNLGVIYEQMGFTDRAEVHYLKALELDSDYLPSYTNLAFLYKERGDLPRAVSYFRTRIEYAPENDEWVALLSEELRGIDPSYRTGIVETQLEETSQRLFQAAQEELSLTVARADGHYRQAQKFLSAGQFEQASDEIGKALALTPDNPRLKEVRRQIRYDQRISDIKKKINRATELMDSGDMDSARQEFQAILTILPGKSIQE